MTYKLCLPADTASAVAAHLIATGNVLPDSSERIAAMAMGQVRDLTVADASKVLGVSETTLRKRIQAGTVPSYRVPGTVQGSIAWRVQVVG